MRFGVMLTCSQEWDLRQMGLNILAAYARAWWNYGEVNMLPMYDYHQAIKK